MVHSPRLDSYDSFDSLPTRVVTPTGTTNRSFSASDGPGPRPTSGDPATRRRRAAADNGMPACSGGAERLPPGNPRPPIPSDFSGRLPTCREPATLLLYDTK